MSHNPLINFITSSAVIMFFAIFTFSGHQAYADLEYDLSGYGTVGLGVADGNDIDDARGYSENYFDSDPNAKIDTRIGVQGSVFFNDYFSTTLQLVSRGTDDFEPTVDWAYLGYRANDQWSFRLGRMVRPIYNVSDHIEVGYTYDWVRPPMEMYSNYIRSFGSVDGVSTVFQTPIGRWDVGFEAYYGNTEGDLTVGPEFTTDYEEKNTAGIVFFAESNSVSFSLNYHYIGEFSYDLFGGEQALYLGLTEAGFTQVAEQMDTKNFTPMYLNASIGIDHNDWLLSGEYTYVPDIDSYPRGLQAWYVNVGRRIGSYTGYFMFSRETGSNKEKLSTTEIEASIAQLETQIGLCGAFCPPQLAQGKEGLEQLLSGVEAINDVYPSAFHSYTTGVRYDFMKPVALKFELQHQVHENYDASETYISAAIDFLF